jgi:LysM repeat protein
MLALLLAAAPAFGKATEGAREASKTSISKLAKAQGSPARPTPASASKGSRARSSAASAPPAQRTSSAVSPAPTTRRVPPDLATLGSLSVGHPSAGFLVNAVAMPRSTNWTLTVPDHSFGTRETVAGLARCIDHVHVRFAGSAAVMLGSISGQFGGKIAPHKSHRTGRDADVYFFRQPGAQWVKAATVDDIDLPRTWELLKCFVSETDVDMVLIDRRVQAWLETYALKAGEPATWVQAIFHDDPATHRLAVVRHEPGHVAHMHVRFVSAESRRAALKVYDRLVAAGVVLPEMQAIQHAVKKGETLSQIARTYGIEVSHIRDLNGLSGSLIRPGQKLTIRRAQEVRGARDPVLVPPRLAPPGPGAQALRAKASVPDLTN